MRDEGANGFTLHGTGVKQQLTLGLVSVNVQQTFATWGTSYCFWNSGGSILGQAWGQKEILDSFLLWEEKPCGMEGRRRESQTISALIRALSASVSLGVCSLVCVREFGTDPKLVK